MRTRTLPMILIRAILILSYAGQALATEVLPAMSADLDAFEKVVIDTRKAAGGKPAATGRERGSLGATIAAEARKLKETRAQENAAAAAARSHAEGKRQDGGGSGAGGETSGGAAAGGPTRGKSANDNPARDVTKGEKVHPGQNKRKKDK